MRCLFGSINGGPDAVRGRHVGAAAGDVRRSEWHPPKGPSRRSGGVPSVHPLVGLGPLTCTAAHVSQGVTAQLPACPASSLSAICLHAACGNPLWSMLAVNLHRSVLYPAPPTSKDTPSSSLMPLIASPSHQSHPTMLPGNRFCWCRGRPQRPIGSPARRSAPTRRKRPGAWRRWRTSIRTCRVARPRCALYVCYCTSGAL